MPQSTVMARPVAQAFDAIDPVHRETLLAVRELVFEVAGTDARIGPIDEAWRWGEPAYLTAKAKTGSTIRLGVERASRKPALFFNCPTTLVEGFRAQFGTRFSYVKNRAILLEGASSDALAVCIAAALTYHLPR